MYSTIMLSAPNDKNGNPRRLYITLSSGHLVAVYRENYNGIDCVTSEAHKEAYHGGVISTTVEEYKKLIKRWKLD